MKHYVDIENIRDSDTDFVRQNTGAFQPGDIISITEKIDGSNASFTFEGSGIGFKPLMLMNILAMIPGISILVNGYERIKLSTTMIK